MASHRQRYNAKAKRWVSWKNGRPAWSTSTSWYRVRFDNSVSDCLSGATPGNAGGGLPPKGQVTAGFGTLEITVHTTDSMSGKVDFGFHLLVVCKSGPRSAAAPSEGPQSEAPQSRTTTTHRWAVVNKDGTLVRGAGVASLARLGTEPTRSFSTRTSGSASMSPRSALR
jgi:hypothetical protein